MHSFKQINQKEKFSSFCQYIFIAMLPIIGIVFLSIYAFLYIKEDYDFVSKELAGLEIITQLQESVFKIQRLRGLSSIASCDCNNTNVKIAQDIEELKNEIAKDIVLLQGLIQSKQSFALQEKLLAYVSSIEIHNDPTTFQALTNRIHDFLYFATKIAYECNLKFEPYLDSYVMVDNVTSLLPKIIEYNGQIRASSSAIQNKRLLATQKEDIKVQLHKIEEQLELLRFNYSMLEPYDVYKELEESYQKMLDAQNEIISIVHQELLEQENIELEGLNIYEIITNNIDRIINLQRMNVAYLHQELLAKYHYKKSLINTLVLVSAFSLLFILYVYYYFYQTNKKYIYTIEKLSITDGMTQLYNRRYFDLIIEQQLKLLHRHKEKFIFMLLDIDFFKQYNDTYGHQAGDEALKKVAACLQSALHRESDMAFRLGGEEFGVLGVAMDEAQALELAQKIRSLIASEQIEHKTSSVSEYLSLSIGVVAVSSKDAWDVNSVYRSADKALYEAKEKGRNRVALFQATT